MRFLGEIHIVGLVVILLGLGPAQIAAGAAKGYKIEKFKLEIRQFLIHYF